LSFEGPLAVAAQFFCGRLVYRGIKKETPALKNYCEERYGLDKPGKQGRTTPRNEYREPKPGRIDIDLPDLELALS
jgi:hypothetical protein